MPTSVHELIQVDYLAVELPPFHDCRQFAIEDSVEITATCYRATYRCPCGQSFVRENTEKWQRPTKHNRCSHHRPSAPLRGPENR